MKVVAISLMLIGVGLIVVLGFMYLFGFVMSFDAPGSDKDLGAWGFRLFVLLPIILLLVILILSIRAYTKGKYGLSAGLASIISLVVMGLGLIAFRSSNRSLKEYQDKMAQDAEDALLYPKQKFMRPYEGGADTILVFPNRIVSYRLNSAPDFPLSGPLGDLNASRDTIIYYRSPHNNLRIDQLDAFVNEDGVRLTDIYAVR